MLTVYHGLIKCLFMVYLNTQDSGDIFIIFINKKTKAKHANPQVADNQNHTASERD